MTRILPKLSSKLSFALIISIVLLWAVACGKAAEQEATETPASTVDVPQPLTETPIPISSQIVPTIPKDTPDAEEKPIATATPAPEADPLGQPGSAPAPAPVGTVVYYETTITLPTYPYEEYQSPAYDRDAGWTYFKFDRSRFLADNPTPEPREYLALVLENSYLRLTILPELGGRLLQAEHKQSGNRMFYQNEVVKPSPWGPGNQLGWLAVGGLEWNLPVIEHGYDWGIPWGHIPLQHSDDLASVTVFTPRENRSLTASIEISLRAGAASFEIEPLITNISSTDRTFDYWHTAMLAPGSQNRPSADLRFILPADEDTKSVTVHSTGNDFLPEPGEPFVWPTYADRDLSRLGDWNEYLGLFEYPSAAGPFAGVYDEQVDAGAVRVFPAEVARGSKIFAPGWATPLDSENYTDDGSSYVELHGGLAPSFFEQYYLPSGGSVSWREIWYPVQQIGKLGVANEIAALSLWPENGDLQVGLYPTRPMDGTLILTVAGREIVEIYIQVSPDSPFTGTIVDAETLAETLPGIESDSGKEISIRFEDRTGFTLVEHKQ